jgi:hypothetical protein
MSLHLILLLMMMIKNSLLGRLQITLLHQRQLLGRGRGNAKTLLKGEAPSLSTLNM